MTIQRQVTEHSPQQDAIPLALRRRGLIAGAAALVAGLVAKAASEPVEATTGDIIHIGDNNLTGNAKPNEILYTGTFAPPIGMWDIGNQGASNAIRGSSISGTVSSAGVFGESDNGTGVIGLYGSHGFTVPPQGHVGVYGYSISGSAGGYFECTASPISGNGGFGAIARGNGVGGVGLLASSDKGVGVLGQAPGSQGIGVSGQSGGSYGVSGTTGGTGLVAGVYGTSSTAYGIIGSTTAAGYSGLTAITGTAGVAALAATATVSTAYAAFFTGATIVNGNFAVTGSKSAAVMHPDGTRRLLYCTESPEAWFEDFGTGTLANGRTEVKLDPDFAALVRLDDYHVFLTAHSDHPLHVPQRTPSGFTVLAGAGSGVRTGRAVSAVPETFSWRVVARRKDNPGTRWEKFTPIALHALDPDKLPKPEPPKKP